VAGSSITHCRRGTPALSQSRKKLIMEGVRKQRRRRAIASIAIAAVLIAVITVSVYSLTTGNKQNQVIPSNVGISPGTPPCLRPLHTHDGSGMIHVEPDDSSHPIYTIGDFFRIWGKEFNSSGIFRSSQPLPSYLDICVSGSGTYYHNHPTLKIVFKRDAPSSIVMTVNGNPEARMQDYPLPGLGNTAAANIVITYGPGVPAEF